MSPSSRLTGAMLVPLLVGLLLGPFAVPGGARAQQRVDTTDLTERRAQKLFVRGMTQSYLEDHAEAIAYFEKALEVSPGQPAILMALAEAEVARDNVTSALYYARKAREGAPTQPYYAHRLAELLREADRPKEAAATYQTLLETFPGYNEARLPFARLQVTLNRPEDALATYETFVDSAARPNPEVYGEMLDLYVETGDEKGLERTLKTLIRRRRQDRRYRMRLGQLYVKQERFDEAVAVLEALVRETPNDPKLLTRLEGLYEKTGQAQAAEALWEEFAEKEAGPGQLVARARSVYEEAHSADAPLDSVAVQPAVRLLRRALAQDSTHVGALDLLGTLRYETGAYGPAAKALDRALDENPRDPERWQRAAESHLRAGHPQQAAAVAEEGLLLFPGQPALHKTLGFSHLRLGDPDAARSHFQKALDDLDESAADRDRAALRAGLGRAHDRLGNVGRAEEAFQSALALDREHDTALQFYARSLAQRETDLDRALALAQRAVDQASDDPRALGTLGWVQFKRGAVAEAKSAFKNALHTGRAPNWVYEHFGDVHRALGNDSLARRYWNEALDRATNPDSLQKKIDALPQS